LIPTWLALAGLFLVSLLDMQTGPKGRALIKEYEGVKLHAYYCPAGKLTIGVGSTGPHVKVGMTITAQEADDLFTKDLGRFEKAVNRMVHVPLSQEQFDALVSFSFNLGEANLEKSTLLKMLNEKNYSGAANQFKQWNRSRGKILPGLVRRRAAEAALFSSTIERT
jgi:lysozyme